MRILYLANNWVGWQFLQWLTQNGENIVGLVIHPEAKQKYGSEIITAANLSKDCIFTGNTLRKPETIAKINELKPDIGLSVFFGYILRKPLLDLFPNGCLNIHPAYLPYNRGSYPNVWSIVEGTPAGVTLHYIDESIDTGDIVAQKQVEVLPTDTGETLYRRLEQASLELLQTMWPQIVSGTLSPVPQDKLSGTHHFMQDVAQLDQIDINREYKAQELINILRARTFPPYRGAHIEVDEQRIYLRLQLLTEDDLE